MTTSYPRQSARTRRFTLGVPRAFQIAPDGSYVSFLRTKEGTDPVTCLWTVDTATGEERLIADPRSLEAPGEQDLPAEERARRERAREQADGIVGYAIDRAARLAAFGLAGQLYVADLRTGAIRTPAAQGPVFDPRIDPFGRRVAYVSGRTLRVIELSGAAGGGESGTGEPVDRALVHPESEQVSYGLAEFIAAEEMGRMRGYWWAPDGESLLVARVDETPVQRWNIADPANPEQPPTEIAYPAAGTPNAYVALVILGMDGARAGVAWDRGEFPYVVTAHWDRHGLLVVVQSRDQRSLRILEVDPATGATTLRHVAHDPIWLDIVPGLPARTAGGALVWTAEDRENGTRRLTVDGKQVTPAGLQIRSVITTENESVLFTASQEPTEIHLWSYDGSGGGSGGSGGSGGLTRLTDGPGVFSGTRSGSVTVLTGSRLDQPGVTTQVLPGEAPDPASTEAGRAAKTQPAQSAVPGAPAVPGAQAGGVGKPQEIASRAEVPVLSPAVELLHAGDRRIRTAVLLPSGWEPAAGRLPVLMDPYGGPHGQRVLAAQRAYLEAQWLADQGFAVVIADGRGTPGRGPTWDRSVRGDFAGPILDDQIAALQEVARRHPDALDLGRVAIRGWSFGGWLAALAALRRPDVFHAAVAGAPVTDWRLYDTHYTERYLGLPQEEPETYAAQSLIELATPVREGEPPRPLLLIHGLADDNVVAAHTLRLSSALLAAGRPHTVLPLSGVTHMTPQEVVAENLLLLQVDFLKRSLP